MSVEPAALGESPSGHASGVPYSPLYDDVYHAVAGAWAQARHVFLGGNGLPGRWQGRRRFVILETGFGLGNNFLATWSAWRRDARRCDHLFFISIEKHPLSRPDMARVHGLTSDTAGTVQDGDPEAQADRPALARRLAEAWPVATPGMHLLDFDENGLACAEGKTQSLQRVSLLLGLGDIADLLPAQVAQVDAFYLDGFAPAKNPAMWDEALLSRLNRLAAPGATAATWSAARGVREALARAGFRVARVPGFAGKRDMVQAVYEPRYTAPLPAGGWQPEPPEDADRHAVVLGAGLAGCGAALALCRAGWRVTLIDRHSGPAQEASGNPGGLFHSVLHGEDGVHARAHRAAALATWRQVAPWIAQGRLPGDASGLLRLDPRMDGASAHALLARLGLPPDHVQWLDTPQARAQAGIDVPGGGWLFHQAGWLHPARLCQLMLDEAASLTREGRSLLRCIWDREIDGIAPDEDGIWRVTAGGDEVALALTLVLCHAMAASRLSGWLPEAHAVEPLPLSAVRGQITAWPVGRDATRQGVALPSMPVAGAGYALGLPDGALLCGATTRHHDADPSVREADHRHNLAQAARLGVCPALLDDAPLPPGLEGRTAWRATTPDRLPLVGALPWSVGRVAASGVARRDQVRLMPRERGPRGGLFALTGLGSRGITWSALAAELLAHWVTGSPCPVEADLRDALDPARFLVRRMTKGPSDETRVQEGRDTD